MYQQSTYLNKHLNNDIKRLFRVIYLYNWKSPCNKIVYVHMKVEPKANLVIATTTPTKRMEEKHSFSSLSTIHILDLSDNISTENIKKI